MKKLLLLLMVLPAGVSAFTIHSNRVITGTVVSEDDNQPLPGVAVTIDGSKSGTVTDANGH